MSKTCQISGKKSNNGYQVSHSHIRTKKLQHVNLQKKRIWLTKERRFVKLRLSTKALRSVYRIH